MFPNTQPSLSFFIRKMLKQNKKWQKRIKIYSKVPKIHCSLNQQSTTNNNKFGLHEHTGLSTPQNLHSLPFSFNLTAIPTFN